MKEEIKNDYCFEYEVDRIIIFFAFQLEFQTKMKLNSTISLQPFALFFIVKQSEGEK
jgi:hypothetical protein